MPLYPRALPGSLIGLLDPLIGVVGPLAPAEHVGRVREALAGVAVDAISAVGLEVVLPPHPAACDLSVLLPPGEVPPFAGPRHEALCALAQTPQPEENAVWWEYDTSSDDPPAGAFLRQLPDGRQFEAVRAAASSVPGLDRALDALAPLAAGWDDRPGRLLGFFPDRQPLPVAAALIPAVPGVLRELAARVTASVDPDSSALAHVVHHCDRFSFAIGADAEGRTALSVEASFAERERAMADGLWRPVLDDPVWGEGREAMVSLLGIQGMHRFDALPPMGVMTGIDHIKLGPGGRVKAYVGALRLQPGARLV